jgi:hypothetical protein
MKGDKCLARKSSNELGITTFDGMWHVVSREKRDALNQKAGWQHKQGQVM